MSVNRDKETEINVLRYLMSDLGLLNQKDKYILSPKDFSIKQNKLMFLALQILSDSGVKQATVDTVLSVAADNDLFSAIDKSEYMGVFTNISTTDNPSEAFDYCYNKLKKINLLYAMDKMGFNTDEFLVSDGELTNLDSTKINSQFDKLAPNDIINRYRDKLTKLEKDYLTASEISTVEACAGLEELINSFGTQEDLGLQIQGKYQNRIINGARLGTLTIRSASSGSGKTRLAVADACYLAYPIRWEKNRWAINGHCEKVLFIATEQTADEIRRMVLAYLTEIPESLFRYGELTNEQKERLATAVRIMNRYKDNLIITRMPEPSVDGIKNRIREEVRQHGCKYVFFDYISVSPTLYREFGSSNLRTDEALLLMATALKDIAVELNVAVFSATQLNASGDNNGSNNIKNEASLAGARSIINKADNGLIMMRLTEDQAQKAKELNLTYDNKDVNRIFDVYKVRSGDYSQVRVWSYFDMGTLRCYDILVTDTMGNGVDIDIFDNFEQMDDDVIKECRTWIEGGLK